MPRANHRRGYPGGKGHAGEDTHIHQCAAHVGGDHVVKADGHQQIPRQQTHSGDGLHVAPALHPHQLAGQQQDKGQLHHLRRLHLNGDAPDAQPRQIAVGRHTQRSFQQQEEAKVKGQQPLPLFADLRQVHHGHHEIQHNAQRQAAQLDDDAFESPLIPGGAVDHHHAEEGRHGTQGQQQKICLTDNI